MGGVSIAYEVGRRRMPVSSLPVIARYLGVSIEELIIEPPSAAAKKRGPTPKLEQQMEPEIAALMRSELRIPAQEHVVLRLSKTVRYEEAARLIQSLRDAGYRMAGYISFNAR